MIVVILVNYFMATMACFMVALFTGYFTVKLFTLYLGVLTGFLFVLSLILMMISFRQKGTALTSSIVQLGVLIPIALSTIIWAERITELQTFAVFLAILSLILLSFTHNSRGTDAKTLLTPLALFFANGFVRSSGKILLEMGEAEQEVLFFLITFTIAFLASLPLATRKMRKVSRSDFSYGLIIGGFNFVANLGLVIALNTVPGSIAFPVFSSVGLLLTVVMSTILLSEKINKLNAMGIVTCLATVILITM